MGRVAVPQQDKDSRSHFVQGQSPGGLCPPGSRAKATALDLNPSYFAKEYFSFFKIFIYLVAPGLSCSLLAP